MPEPGVLPPRRDASGPAVDSSIAGGFRVERVERGADPLLVPDGELFVVEPDGRPGTLCAPGTSYRVDGVDLTVWRLELDAVRRVAAEVSGTDAVEFTGAEPLSPALARYWTSLSGHLRGHLLDDAEVMASPLVRGETFRQLATGLLVVFPNTTQDPAAGPGARTSEGVEPATVRRAAEFIETHAQEDIDVARIAEAARIGVRGLQQAFRKHRGQTPLEYLRRIRMERVHRDLEAGDPTRGDTVAGTAARWGFTHPGRFSVDYRSTYGCSPSQTLRT